LLAKYPSGCALFGVADGKIVPFYPNVPQAEKIEADWNSVTIKINEPAQRLTIHLPNFRVLHLNPPGPTSYAWNNEEIEVPFKERVQIQSMFEGLYYEVLDIQKKIFLVGFK
jgi:hypothetical protein